MERKGGCCLQAPRYGADIMLKFRPIAPKPMPSAPVTPSAGPLKRKAAGGGKRGRKGGGVAAGAGKRGRKPKKAAASLAVVDVHKERAKEDKAPSPSSSGMTSVDSSPPPATLTHAPSPTTADLQAPAHAVPCLQALRPVAWSCVTVENVTATWRDGDVPLPPSAATCCDDEAPAFVSDQWGRVTWMNLAFGRAVSGGAAVLLAAKDGAAVPAWGACAGFTCRVRVTRYDECPRRGSLVAPCDVWRLHDGGYLWRLDLQASLTLSLGGLL